MKSTLHFFTIVVFFSFSVISVQAQVTILNQSLLNNTSFATFTPVNVSGVQNWYYTVTYGAVCSGFAGGQSHENEDWLMSPVLNLEEMEDVELTFEHTRGSAAVMNVGVAEGFYKVYATANYTGDVATTQWVELSGVNQDVQTAWQYISSGVISIPEAAKSGSTRIAFRYISTATQSATWQIKNVKVTGEPQPTGPGADGAFKITNWNTEWLGCELNGPDDENLQLNNVVTAMQLMNADMYAIQEVSNTDANPTIASIVGLLGSDAWGGAIVPTNTGDCNHRQGIIYRKSKVQFVSSFELSAGSATQGNSYYYNWSSGRFPAVYNLNFIAGSELIPVTLVNIHAKAEDGNAASYTRRLGASEALKEILDGPGYNTKNVILLGDYNDYLTGTTSDSCGCSESPYQNFMVDQTNYTGVTSEIIDANTNWGVHPLIENIIISEELVGNFVGASQEVAVSQAISNFGFTTSNHLPVSATFEFATLSNPVYVDEANLWTVYPNPVKNDLYIVFRNTTLDAAIEIYDLTGRRVYGGRLDGEAVDVSGFPTGIYVVKAKNQVAKFVKE